MTSMTLRSFRDRHFGDYSTVALLYWLLLASLGVTILMLAIDWLVAQPAGRIGHVLSMVAVTGLAACFPFRPSSRVNFYVAGEVFVFLTYLLFGMHAAILAGMCEVAVANSKLTHRVATRITGASAYTAALLISLSFIDVAFGSPLERNVVAGAVVAGIAGMLIVQLAALVADSARAVKNGTSVKLPKLIAAYAVPSMSVALSAILATVLAAALSSQTVHMFVAGSIVVAALMAALHYWQTYKRSEETHSRQLAEAAYTDGLTGLPNRRRFTAILDSLLQQERRPYAVMFLDCDSFKTINDSGGHPCGDAFLCAVAERVKMQVRDFDIVSRLGGDEFAVLLLDVQSGQAFEVAERMVEAMRSPVVINGARLTSTISIGVATSEISYRNAGDLLRDADLAMYAAKELGKNRAVLFDADLSAEYRSRSALETDVLAALESGAFTLAYQPLFRIRDNALIGFEALARWNHPTRGAVSPAAFIPVLTKLGQITRLTRQLIPKAAKQLADWHRLHPRLKLHVNVSAADLVEPDFVAFMHGVVESTGVAPGAMVVELTESDLIDAVDCAMTTLTSLRAAGHGVAIDDFGTGYSSLARLTDMPITSYKIDAAFVRALRPHSKQLEVVKVIVALGATLGKGVIAEGIETEDQLALLEAVGCTHGQGFHYSRPLSASDAQARIEQDRNLGLGPSTIGFEPSGFEASAFETSFS